MCGGGTAHLCTLIVCFIVLTLGDSKTYAGCQHETSSQASSHLVEPHHRGYVDPNFVIAKIYEGGEFTYVLRPADPPCQDSQCRSRKDPNSTTGASILTWRRPSFEMACSCVALREFNAVRFQRIELKDDLTISGYPSEFEYPP